MAYIGRQLARGENKLFDDISSSFNGSTTTFTLAVSSVATATATPYQLFVSLGGVMQKPNTDFTTAGNQITFTTAPAAGLSCWIMMQGDTIDQAAIPDASVTPSKISGSNFAFSGDLRLKDADGSHYVGFASPSTVSTNKVWTLPAADGSASQYLQTNGSGVLTWATVSIGGGTGIDFNDNVKARWGTGNDLEVFHNGSNSVINDAGTGDLLLQVGGSTKATVSSTGFDITGALTVSTNATITGNLTVSGTTTTINTQTLDVEDKNVVIGKVSSPSDTTADGGGWTLKGATDKTLNWVNATDAWTSSEHIHLIDNKKLLVGGASGTVDGLEIVHNGSNSILNDSGTGTLQLQLGGSTKLEIQSGGINVTGAINVNGAALSTAPEVTLTASEAITAADAILVKSNGQAEKVTGVTEATTGTNYMSMTMQVLDVVFDPDNNKIAVIFENPANNGYFSGKVGTISGSGTSASISWGSTTQLDSISPNNHRISACYNTSVDRIFAVTRNNGYQGALIGNTINISGTSISRTADSNNTSDGDNAQYPSCCYNPTGTEVAVVYTHANNSSRVKIILATQGASSITWGGIYTVSGTTQGHYPDVDHNTTDNYYVVTYRDGNNAPTCRLITSSGNGSSPSAPGGTYHVFNSIMANYTGPRICYHPPSNKFLVATGASSQSSGLVGTVLSCTKSNGAISAGADRGLTTYNGTTYGAAGNMQWDMKYDSNSQKIILTWGIRGGNNMYVRTIKPNSSDDTLEFGAIHTIGSASQVHQYLGFAADTNVDKVAILSNFSGSNNSYYNVFTPGSTNLDATRFLGFAKASVSSGADVTVKIDGNTLTGSSLTPNSTYYVQGDGTVATTAASPSVQAGKALTSTKLLIKT